MIKALFALSRLTTKSNPPKIVLYNPKNTFEIDNSVKLKLYSSNSHLKNCFKILFCLLLLEERRQIQRESDGGQMTMFGTQVSPSILNFTDQNQIFRLP